MANDYQNAEVDVTDEVTEAKRAMREAKETLWREFCSRHAIPDDMDNAQSRAARKGFDMGWWGMAQMVRGISITLKAAVESGEGG